MGTEKRKIKIIGYPGPSGSRLWRMEQIFKYLNITGDYQCVVSPNAVNDEELLWSDIIYLQHVIDPRMISDAWCYKVERNKALITDIDDTLEYKESSPFYERNKNLNTKIWQRELVKVCDAVTVTTKSLSDEVKKYTEDVHILPNYFDPELWNYPIAKNDTGMIRIGWNGSITHRPDLEMVAPLIKKMLKKYPQVKFVSCGDPKIDQMFSDCPPTQHENIPAMPSYYKWGQYACTLMYDIGIAPLTDEHFNYCKSNIKYQEYALTKTAGVYSPPAYEGFIKQGETGFIAHDLDEWEEYLTLLITNPNLRKHIQDKAYKEVSRSYDIRKHISKWDKLYSSLVTFDK